MKPRHLIVFLACLSPLGLAQVASEAARILDKIRLAHGGAALAALRTYQETATLTTFSGPETERTLTVVSYVDFTQNRLRIEYKDGSQLIQVIQVSPSGGETWSALGGKKPLEPAFAQELRQGLYQTWYGLRLGGSGREMAQILGKRTFGDVDGWAVAVRTQSSQTTYLVNAQNQLIAERYESAQGPITVLYADLRRVSGVLIPFRARLYTNGVLFAEARVRRALVNPPLDPGTFRLP